MQWDDLRATDPERARRMAMRALRVYFAEKRWSRLVMSLILLLTGAAGVGASWSMLQLGLEKMWVRYPLAALIAWGIFLLLVWIWAQVERRYFRADEHIEALLKGHDPAAALTRLKDKDSSVLDWFDFTPDFEDEGSVVVLIGIVAIGLLFFAFIGLFGVLMAAPALIAEVFVDAVLITALHKRMKHLKGDWWVFGAVRQTAKPVLLTATGLCLCGVLFGWFAPEAKSLGGVVARLRGKTPVVQKEGRLPDLERE